MREDDVSRRPHDLQISHPTAAITGFFRGNLHVVIAGQSNITCPATKLRAIVHYPDEVRVVRSQATPDTAPQSWVGKNKFKIAGIVFEADEDDVDADADLRIKDVDEDRIVARFEGSWRGKVTWWRTRDGDDNRRTLIDMSALLVAPKTCRPIEAMDETESRRLWKDVTEAILDKQFGQATKVRLPVISDFTARADAVAQHKQAIEQRQRDKAKARADAGESWTPRYFGDYSDGRPQLTDAGRSAVKEDLSGAGYPAAASS